MHKREKRVSEKKTVLSVRMPEELAEKFKAEAARAGIGVSVYLLRKLAPDYVLGTKEHFEAVIKGPSDRVPPQGAEQLPRVAEGRGDPVVTARSLFDHYRNEPEIPEIFKKAHDAGVIPLSWFTARYGYPDASHIDAFDEFMSIDDPKQFGLNEPCWEFVE